MLVKSGIIRTLITFGIDLLLILAMEVALPLLFALVDAVMCAIQFFNPGVCHQLTPSTNPAKCAFISPLTRALRRYLGCRPRMCGLDVF